MHLRILSCLALLLTAVIAPASHLPGNPYFKVIDTSDGLPDNSVNAIAEDKMGFLWIGTWHGLARYDGNSIETFTISNSSRGSASDMVRALLPDQDGIWVANDNGVDYMRFDNGRFNKCRQIVGNGDTPKLLLKRISRIIRNGDEIFLVSIDGELLRLDRSCETDDDVPGIFKLLPKPLNRQYADICLMSDKKMLALSNDGITVLSPTGERELLHNSHTGHFDTNMNIFCDTINNKVYVGGGIGTVATVFDITSPDGRLEKCADQPRATNLMATCSDGTDIYMATDGCGLLRYSGDGDLTSFTPANSSLPCDALYTAYADTNGNIWCGTYRHGLCLLSPALNRCAIASTASGSINYNIVTAIVPYGEKLLLGLDGGGLDIYDRQSGTSRNINSANSDLPANNIVSIVNDGDKAWAAIYSAGLAEIDLPTGKVRTHTVDTGYEPGNKLWTIADDGAGNLWVGGRALHVFNKAKGTFEPVEGCTNLMVMSIINRGREMLVATRFEGILQIDKETKKVLGRFSRSPSTNGVLLPSNQASSLFIDRTGILWATLGDKFYTIDRSNGDKVEEIGADKGLTESRVYSMLEDANGDVWAATANGLFKYIRRRDIFVRQSNPRLPSTFTSNAALLDGNTMYFGSTGGLLSMPSGSGDGDATPPSTIFTKIEVLDHNSTSLSLNSTGERNVNLKCDQNFFRIYFTVPYMATPEQIHFECRLEGLEDVWHDATGTRAATYTNVPPGDYRFEVRHSSPDGTWTEPAVMRLSVAAPWFKTPLAIILWIILIIAAVSTALIAWHRYIVNGEKARLAELERDAARQLNDAKLDFYANITHELRTPCFLISAQIEEAFDSERQTVPVASLQGIYRNAMKLNSLINQILDLRKIESGKMKIVARRTELSQFLAGLAPDYEQLCRQKAITFTYTHDTAPLEATIDPDKLELIVTNLITNAYKYTPKGGRVDLTLADKGTEVEITVSDTGIGIVDKMQAAIFEPFVRTERGVRQSSGDGLGLSLVKDLVELHGGTIDLESEVNEGSKFIVILPKENPNANSGTDDEADRTDFKAIAGSEGADTPAIDNPTATRSILIVDDDAEVRSLVHRAFENDYRIRTAADSANALDILTRESFDVVMTDIMMPGADGHDLIASIKANKKLASMKIVVFSALTGEDDMMRALNQGIDVYLTKPTSMKVLRRQVDRLFENDTMPLSGTVPSSTTYTREEQRFLLECRRIIDESLSDDDFGIEMIAHKLAMSHSSLYKKVRRLTGLSLIDFINEYRICKAVSLFKQGNTNVQKVAEMCGFRDIKTFRETFKKKMGMPPKAYILKLS